jgi:hypothetical protein
MLSDKSVEQQEEGNDETAELTCKNNLRNHSKCGTMSQKYAIDMYTVYSVCKHRQVN